MFKISIVAVLAAVSVAKRGEGNSAWTSCPGRCFDGVCRDVGNFKGLSVADCQRRCLNTTRCTAINYGRASCALRACPVGTPPEWLIHGLTGYAHYPVKCDAPIPPSPSPPVPPPSPSPPGPPPTPPISSGNQVHLSLGSAKNTYVVTWSTNHSLSGFGGSLVELTAHNSTGSTAPPRTVLGTEDVFVDNGTLHHTQFIHRATLTALTSGSLYSYRVACDGGGFCSKIFKFVATFRGLSDRASFTVFGDMGIWNNKAFDQLLEDAAKRDTDVLIHNGDMAYDLHMFNASRGDRWLNQMQPIAATQPYMVSQGNHESIYDGLGYTKRFTMPTHNLTHNLWYSFEFGNTHWVAYTTEAYFTLLDHRYPLSGRDRWGPYPAWAQAQRKFLERDLSAAAARRANGTGPQWLVAFGHRPMYCSDRGCDNAMASPQHIQFRNDLEPLLYKHGVDIIFEAHEHTYERMWPMFNGTVLNGTFQEPYVDPRGPVHIVGGAAGCGEHSDNFLGPLGPWSAVRLNEYGYGKLRVWNKSHATWTQIRSPDGAVRDVVNIVKTRPSYHH